jgi:hypothetical protein
METDIYNRAWIIEHAQDILEEYSGGITIRQLHYRLVAIGMTNDMNHYKRVVTAMTEARWNDIIGMESFIDRERAMYGETEADEVILEDSISKGKEQIEAWMEAYNLNRWSNQENYVEVWVEKKALQGVFETPCRSLDVGLAPCKGYPSITFLYEASQRFEKAETCGQNPIILYFGDYDPSGEDIPRSIEENLLRMGVDIKVERIALNTSQIREMNLPSVPPKSTDTRTRNWSGNGVVELDAVEPHTLEQMCKVAIEDYFDDDRYMELKQREDEERAKYQKELKVFVRNLK